jgi:hypothetical protein
MLLYKKSRLFTQSADKDVRRFSSKRPAVLKTLLLAAEEAGTLSTLRITANMNKTAVTR